MQNTDEIGFCARPGPDRSKIAGTSPRHCMFSSQFLVVLGSAAVTLLAWLVGPPAIGRSLKSWELVLVAAVALGLLQWQRQRRLRRHRQEIESIRDSALW